MSFLYILDINFLSIWLANILTLIFKDFLIPGPDLLPPHPHFKRIYKEKEALYVCPTFCIINPLTVLNT